MIALNIVLMAVVIAAIALVLAWAIISDRRSKRAAGGPVHPSDAPLHQNLMMPREMRSSGPRAGRVRGKRRSEPRSPMS